MGACAANGKNITSELENKQKEEIKKYVDHSPEEPENLPTQESPDAEKQALPQIIPEDIPQKQNEAKANKPNALSSKESLHADKIEG